jgi:superfamily II DNA/RNA helicase
MLMVLSPTRELAQQIAVEAASLSTFHKFSVVTLVGKAYTYTHICLSLSLLIIGSALDSFYLLSSVLSSLLRSSSPISLFVTFFSFAVMSLFLRLGGTNIESDKRALGRDTTDIIVGTPGA